MCQSSEAAVVLLRDEGRFSRGRQGEAVLHAIRRPGVGMPPASLNSESYQAAQACASRQYRG